MSWLYRGRKNPLKRLHLLIGEFAPIEGEQEIHAFVRVRGRLSTPATRRAMVETTSAARSVDRNEVTL